MKTKRGLALWIWILIILIVFIVGAVVYYFATGDSLNSILPTNSIPSPPSLPE